MSGATGDRAVDKAHVEPAHHVAVIAGDVVKGQFAQADPDIVGGGPASSAVSLTAARTVIISYRVVPGVPTRVTCTSECGVSVLVTDRRAVGGTATTATTSARQLHRMGGAARPKSTAAEWC